MKIIQKPDSINDNNIFLKRLPALCVGKRFLRLRVDFFLLSCFLYSTSTDNCPGSDGLFGAHCFPYCFPPPSPWRVSLNLEL